MTKQQFSKDHWYPDKSGYLILFFILANFFELGIHRIALFLHKPVHELAEIPNQFFILVPFSIFSIYLLEIASFITMLFLSIHIVKIPIRSNMRRLLLGSIVFFTLPVLTINGLIIASYNVNNMLWYYLSVLSLLLFISYTFWLHGFPKIPFKNYIFWYLLLLPPLFLITTHLFKPGTFNGDFSGVLGNFLIKFGNYLFIYQGIFWPFLILKKRHQYSSIVLLISLSIISVFALWSKIHPDQTADLLYSGFRITLSLEYYGKFFFFVSLWSSIYTIIMLSLSGRWNRILSMGLVLWILIGYSPFVESDVFPIVVTFLVILLGLAFSNNNSDNVYFTDYNKVSLQKLLNIELKKYTKTKNLLIFKVKNMPIKIFIRKSLWNKSSFAIIIGNDIKRDEPDWIATSLPLVPLTRHMFPLLPRVFSIKKKKIKNYAIWDRNFFTDSIITSEIDKKLQNYLKGEIRIWWGSSIVFESPDSRLTEKELRAIFQTILKLAQSSLVT